MTRKRARKILMSIGTSRDYANWVADSKAALEDKRRRGRGYADNHLYADLLRKKMDEGGITKESAFHAGEMKASEL